MTSIKKKNVASSVGVEVVDRQPTADAVELSTASRDKRADKARTLLTASMNLFENRHFAEVSTKEIAAAAGMNPAMLYYYFESKEELFRSVVETTVHHALQHFRDLQDEAKSPRDIISGWLETHIRQFEIIRKFVKMSLNYRSSGTRCAEIDAAISRFYDTERSVLTSAIETGIKNRSCDVVDAGQIASLISTFLDGIMVRSIILPNLDATREIGRFNVMIHVHLNWRI
ncbi:TetR/AcrR family transcriptional regulator [Hyphomicrobium sp.]|uniref:TetR/AcrR family transcriptional regulator n=1 Tax=Hyphomicrobium sp. TaxID=82 RepID=UPI0025C0C73B|nr:TetR/AcrR family transcriptional regulator [Hyphomicrobium sp.]